MQREFKISLSQEHYSDVVYLSQYDDDYDVIFHVTNKYSAADVGGKSAKFTGTRSDGLGFTFTSTAVGSSVSFHINTSLTACAGTHTAEIIFYNNDGLKFGSANIQVIVEKAAHPDGTIDADEEQLRELAEQVQEIVDTAAAEVKGEAESWAVGERDGEPVSSDDPTYENNAKYYSQQAAQIAEDISGVTNQVATNTSDISDLKEDLNTLSGFSRIQFTDGGYIATSGATVDINTVTSNSLYRYAVVDCTEGNKFIINGEAGSTPRLWCFVDASGNSLGKADDTATATDLVLTAPTDATKLIINDKKSGGVCYIGVAYTIPDVISELNERIDAESDELDVLKAVTTADSYETVAFGSEETSTAYNTDNPAGTAWAGAHSFIKSVTPGERYSITTTVIANSKYYAVMYYNGTTYVSGEVQGISGTQQEIAGHEFAIPTGVNRIIVCTYTATTPVLQKITLGPYIDTSVGRTVPNYVIYDGTTLTVKCRYNSTEDLVVQLKKRGNNNLFDFDKIFTCSHSDVLDADVSSSRSILTANTDCFSPHQVRAKSNADGDSSDVFLTGGNHNHNNVPTATCTSINVYVDGVKTASFSGLCSHIRVEWTNLIQGYNTWKANGTGRAILQEDITLDISGSTFTTSVKQTALEDIYQAVYYGLQSINTPYSTILFVGGANRMAEAVSTARNSGDLKARRTLAINSSTHDALETYVNPEDLGSFDFTGATYSIFTANNKCYYAIMRDQSIEMAEGEVYCLLGHYRFWSES